MSISRRGFLKCTAAVGGAVGLGAIPEFQRSPKPIERARKPLNILILGGTGFTGPEQVEYAIARGHKVTLINRNKTRPDFFKGRVEQLIGDMNGDMSALKGLKFDVVIDNPTTLPAWVRNVAQYMKGNTESLHLHLDDLGLSGQQQAECGRDGAADADAGRSRPVHRRLRRTPGKYYGALKTFSEGEVERAVSGHEHDHSAGVDRRPARPHGSFHLLAVSHRQGR